jgi:transposase-like protein
MSMMTWVRAWFADRDLSGSDYVYVWADGIHLRIRLEQTRSFVLVMIGVRADFFHVVGLYLLVCTLGS